MGKGLCDRLQRLQNSAGRIITFSDPLVIIIEDLRISSKTWDGIPLSKDALKSSQEVFSNL